MYLGGGRRPTHLIRAKRIGRIRKASPDRDLNHWSLGHRDGTLVGYPRDQLICDGISSQGRDVGMGIKQCGVNQGQQASSHHRDRFKDVLSCGLD